MNKKIKELNEKKKKIDEGIQQIWQHECEKLTDSIKENKIDEDEALSQLSEYVKNSEEIEKILRLFIKTSDKKGLSLKRIKENLAERLCISAKNNFLDVRQDDLSEALKLFKEVNDEDKIKKCKRLFNAMLEISDSIKIEE